MNFKRGKTKRHVRCTFCTPYRWRGNHQGRFKRKDEIEKKVGFREIAER